jgi:hypothetical protein
MQLPPNILLPAAAATPMAPIDQPKEKPLGIAP